MSAFSCFLGQLEASRSATIYRIPTPQDELVMTVKRVAKTSSQQVEGHDPSGRLLGGVARQKASFSKRYRVADA